jgi:hypothetical protein
VDVVLVRCVLDDLITLNDAAIADVRKDDDSVLVVGILLFDHLLQQHFLGEFKAVYQGVTSIGSDFVQTGIDPFIDVLLKGGLEDEVSQIVEGSHPDRVLRLKLGYEHFDGFNAKADSGAIHRFVRPKATVHGARNVEADHRIKLSVRISNTPIILSF